MRFIDEVVIDVAAGKGGDGCLSFRREKFIEFGGPDGGDGGDGGSVWLQATDACNTLVNYRYKKHYKANAGQPGMGRLRRGKSSDDLVLMVPVGTQVFHEETDALMGDLVEVGQRVCVAKGGFHGLGNARFKSSVNQAPRKITKGGVGESRQLRLVLSVLADVGLVGFPNAGKSTFLRAVSAAKPKVADYPFTTLKPHLGVVRVDELQSFVVADIPGLIEGASQGCGLGIGFLKHLSRTRVLLHLVDASSADIDTIMSQVKQIEHELRAYRHDFLAKPRVLVLSKVDLIDRGVLSEILAVVSEKAEGAVLDVGAISSLSGEGVSKLCYQLMQLCVVE